MALEQAHAADVDAPRALDRRRGAQAPELTDDDLGAAAAHVEHGDAPVEPEPRQCAPKRERGFTLAIDDERQYPEQTLRFLRERRAAARVTHRARSNGYDAVGRVALELLRVV